MSKKGFGKFILGAAVGAGLGILFAPEKGSETRKVLKNKFDDLLIKVKEIDVEEVKEDFENKITEIKKDLKDLDKEKVLELAKDKSDKIIKKITKLAKNAKKRATPVVENAIEELRLSAVKVTKEVLEKLEKTDKEK